MDVTPMMSSLSEAAEIPVAEFVSSLVRRIRQRSKRSLGKVSGRFVSDRACTAGADKVCDPDLCRR
jgi:hypothetical protein